MFYSFDGKVPVVGRGTYVSELATVIGNVEIGEDCYVGPGAILRGDHGRIEIGDGSAVEEGVIIHAAPGHTQAIGRKVTLGHGAMVHARTIGDGAVVGMGAVVSIESEIGAGAIVAEGTVVKWGQSIEAEVMAAGNPAREIRAVNDKDRLIWGYGKQLYIDLAHKYLEEGMHPVEPVRKP
ncbi:MAG TPA: gamma carbonic anhydrase family protein [Desulfobacteraceae bacterium]|nr:gamma carbonic anhydrase family protein [Deltaproteobacteria bacterium]MBW2356081.1 gamma carbonic anhydrase family protein [Deltaproteobacteria bacterium]RLB93280.1 MAG: gamma carbonic anhydrase family protein [Deltaproteobacteria bacterium]HDI60465.1 gamma carbonic anhydrase family protein [Desulfobacteraceae bacterium]